MVVMEDVSELGLPLPTSSRAEFERRPAVPLLRSSEAALKKERYRPDLRASYARLAVRLRAHLLRKRPHDTRLIRPGAR